MHSKFETLIAENRGRILAIARRYADEEHVDDLYQEILEQLWRSFKSFRQESKPETWVYRIGFNTAMTRLRKVVKHRKGQETLAAQPLAESTSADHCEAELLKDFLDSLGDVDASILMMYLDGLTGQEMADVLGMGLSAIQVRINRLKTAFTDQYVEV